MTADDDQNDEDDQEPVEDDEESPDESPDDDEPTDEPTEEDEANAVEIDIEIPYVDYVKIFRSEVNSAVYFMREGNGIDMASNVQFQYDMTLICMFQQLRKSLVAIGEKHPCLN